MTLSPVPSPCSSRPGTPDLHGALHEHGSFVHQLVGFANQIASNYQGVLGHYERQQAAHNNLLATKAAELERVVDNEAILRQAHEGQLASEQQQWFCERDALQKALQEQQGTAFPLQQQQQERILQLEQELQRQETAHAVAVAAYQETAVKQEDIIDTLQQQQQELRQDLTEALAYRQKCIVQRQTIDRLTEQAGQCQQSNFPNQAVATEDGAIDLTADGDQEVKPAGDAHTVEVKELRRSREVIKQAYQKEKIKADRYRTAYKNLRDSKQPVHIANRHRGAAVASSMPQIGGHARLSSNAADPSSEHVPEAAAARPVKAKPSKQHCFTAEMDLAAAGFLQQPPAPAVPSMLSTDGDIPQSCVRHSSGEIPPLASSRHSQHSHRQLLQAQKQSHMPVCSHRQAHTHGQADGAHGSEELSPAAKKLLIATGLMSQDQGLQQLPAPAVSQDLAQHQHQSPQLHSRPAQPAVVEPAVGSGRLQQQPEQGSLEHMTDAVQQLDRDSICRISDACCQPAKRSKSCPPDSCHAESAQASGSQTVSGAPQVAGGADSDPDEVMSEHQSGLLQPEPSMSGLQTYGFSPGHHNHSQQQRQQRQTDCIPQQQYLEHQQQRDGFEQTRELIAEPAGSAVAAAASPRSPQAHAAPMQYDSLDVTQPNLTPAPHPPHSMLATAQPTSANGNCALEGNAARRSVGSAIVASHAAQRSAAAKLPQRKTHCSSTSISAAAQPRLGKSNSGKWRQRAGQRDAAFAGTDEPHMVVSEALLEQPHQLQQAVAAGAEAVCGLEIPGNAAQPRGSDGGYKYQEVVRKKADREALQGIQCLDCRHFYEAVNTWGHARPLPACGHIQQDAAQRQAVVPNAQQQLHQDASRHRYRHAPPGTPVGFWDMGFTDSLDSRM